jgi:hypothetical protein
MNIKKTRRKYVAACLYASLACYCARANSAANRREGVATVDNIMSGTVVLPSYPNPVTTPMTPPFGMSGATGLSNGLPAAGTVAVAVIDQRQRNAKLGRPPRGNHC